MTDDVRIEVRGTGPIKAERGENLRKALLKNGLNPFKGVPPTVSCHGLGICGTCEVYVLEDSEEQPRRACQIRCFSDMTIRLR